MKKIKEDFKRLFLVSDVVFFHRNKNNLAITERIVYLFEIYRLLKYIIFEIHVCLYCKYNEDCFRNDNIDPFDIFITMHNTFVIT